MLLKMQQSAAHKAQAAQPQVQVVNLQLYCLKEMYWFW